MEGNTSEFHLSPDSRMIDASQRLVDELVKISLNEENKLDDIWEAINSALMEMSVAQMEYLLNNWSDFVEKELSKVQALQNEGKLDHTQHLALKNMFSRLKDEIELELNPSDTAIF